MPKPFAFTLCADDYAIAPGVSRGILEAVEAGAVTATSVMTTSDWWPHDAAALARVADRCDIGLHLNLTAGRPLGPMPTLAPGGTLPGIGHLLKLGRGHRLPFREIAEEIDRQMERFYTVFGRAPDHVDGHQHVQALSAIRPLVFEALARRRWRPYLRDSADLPPRILRRGTTLKKAIGVAFIAQDFGRQARRHGLPVNEGFAGFSSFDVSASYGDLFRRFLVAPGPHHLVMCHPGYVDDPLRSIDPVLESRERELAFLTSPAFKATLTAANATVRRF
jgi:predicted glycoside hydrolase/deacetylase ChbG (UPF0249 family)